METLPMTDKTATTKKKNDQITTQAQHGKKGQITNKINTT